MLPPSLQRAVVNKEPLLWLNEHWLPLRRAPATAAISLDDVYEAEARLSRFAPALQTLFPELIPSGGVIESPLRPAVNLQRDMTGSHDPGRWFIKCDHALPVAGSIKARGGIYEVFVHAENLVRCADLTSPEARALFARHQVAVGSTGNLGLSIGLTAAALGFRATVHMSADAKAWKKARLKAHGVEVIEHSGDYGAAVAAGRAQAQQSSTAYFVDDENSKHLFLGYSVAAVRLKQQLAAQRVAVDAEHPLFVYLPCGVGGAPGGITFGLRQLFGDDVHCFLAEPVASPCMLLRLASTENRSISVRDVGLDNHTEADGLAVAQASEFVAQIIKPLVSGVFTVPDHVLFEDLYRLQASEGLTIEPSAAAGLRGPQWLLYSEQGRQYLTIHDLLPRLNRATHILWTTGGDLVPAEEYRRFYERGRHEYSQRSSLL